MNNPNESWLCTVVGALGIFFTGLVLGLRIASECEEVPKCDSSEC